MMVCGIDEAGRGSLCGSLFIAGLASDEEGDVWLKQIGVKDSKKLSKPKRFKLADLILNTSSLYFYIVEKTALEIDTKGLSLCLKEGIEEIITHILPYTKEFCIDGNTLFGLKSTQQYVLNAIVKGDDKISQISGASILAKTAKDTQMNELDVLYPQYSFKSNAGYGTQKHLNAIKEFGLTKLHRKTFLRKIQ